MMTILKKSLAAIIIFLLTAPFLIPLTSSAQNITEIRIPVYRGWNLLPLASEIVRSDSPLKLSDFRYVYVYDPAVKSYILIRSEYQTIRGIPFPSERHSGWFYSEREGVLILRWETTFREFNLENYIPTAGWNFLWVTPEMVGKSLNTIRGSCNFERAYVYYASVPNWQKVSLDEVIGSNNDVGKGFLARVSTACRLSSGVPIPPLPPPTLPPESPTPTITILSPNGGETFYRANNQVQIPVKWTSSGILSTANLDVVRLRSYDSGVEYNLANYVANDGYEPFLISSSIPDGAYTLEIKSPPLFDSSDSYFKIVTQQAGILALTAQSRVDGAIEISWSVDNRNLGSNFYASLLIQCSQNTIGYFLGKAGNYNCGSQIGYPNGVVGATFDLFPKNVTAPTDVFFTLIVYDLRGTTIASEQRKVTIHPSYDACRLDKLDGSNITWDAIEDQSSCLARICDVYGPANLSQGTESKCVFKGQEIKRYTKQITAVDFDNSPDYSIPNTLNRPITPANYPDLFNASSGRGDYIGGGICLWGVEPNPTNCKATDLPYTTYFDYCVNTSQLNEAFVFGERLNAAGISAPAGYECRNGAFQAYQAQQGTLIPSDTFVNFNLAQGQSNPPVYNLHLTNPSTVSVNFTLNVPNQPSWLDCLYSTQTLTLNRGEVAGVCVAINASKVSSLGTYSTNLVVSGNFSNSPIIIPVTLTLRAADQ